MQKFIPQFSCNENTQSKIKEIHHYKGMLFAFPCFLGDSPNKALSFTLCTQCLLYPQDGPRGDSSTSEQWLCLQLIHLWECWKSPLLRPHW